MAMHQQGTRARQQEIMMGCLCAAAFVFTGPHALAEPQRWRSSGA